MNRNPTLTNRIENERLTGISPGFRSRRESEVLDGVGVGVGFLRILGVGVGIFYPTPTPKVQFNYFSTCVACLFLPAAQASSSWALLWLIINPLMSLINYCDQNYLTIMSLINFSPRTIENASYTLGCSMMLLLCQHYK